MVDVKPQAAAACSTLKRLRNPRCHHAGGWQSGTRLTWTRLAMATNLASSVSAHVDGLAE